MSVEGGQTRTSAVATVRSALPPITDLLRPPPHVRKVPTGFLAINHQQKIILQPRNTASKKFSFMVNDEDAPTDRPAGALGWAGPPHLFYRTGPTLSRL